MPPSPENGSITRQEFNELKARVKEIEEGEKGVIPTRLGAVERRLTWQTTALFGAAISFLLMSLTIALSVGH